MLPDKRRYFAGTLAVLAGAFTLFCALTAASAHTQGVCSVPGDHATLQAAVDDAACETVNLGAGTFYENVTIISRTLTIQGHGVDQTIVDGNASGRVFSISGDAVVTLTGLTVTNGSASSGGGIAVSAGGGEHPEVHVVRCKIAGNSATYGGGGLVYSDMLGSTTVYLIDTTVEGNSATHGGGIYSGLGGRLGAFSDARVYVTSSTLRGNVASDAGGGICTVGYSTIYVTNSTISGNSSSDGGGIYNGGGGVEMTYSTLSGNNADDGGGIYNSWYDDIPYVGYTYFRASNSILADSLTGGDCFNFGDASFSDGGHNIVEDGSCISAVSSRSGDPMLGPLQDNGGPTYTHAPAPGSPAIDGGDNAACPATDQRGYPRPLDGDENGTAICDIGSYEIFNVTDVVYLPLIGK